MRAFWSVTGAVVLGFVAVIGWVLVAQMFSREWSGWPSWVLFAILFVVAVSTTAVGILLLVRSFKRPPYREIHPLNQTYL